MISFLKVALICLVIWWGPLRVEAGNPNTYDQPISRSERVTGAYYSNDKKYLIYGKYFEIIKISSAQRGYKFFRLPYPTEKKFYEGWSLYKMDLKTKEIEKIVDLPIDAGVSVVSEHFHFAMQQDLVTYSLPEDGIDKIYLLRPDGSQRKLLVTGGSFPVLSPDAKKIAYIKTNLTMRKEHKVSLWEINTDGSQDHLIRDIEEFYKLSWKDDTTLLFTTNSPIPDVYAVDSLTGEMTWQDNEKNRYADGVSPGEIAMMTNRHHRPYDSRSRSSLSDYSDTFTIVFLPYIVNLALLLLIIKILQYKNFGLKVPILSFLQIGLGIVSIAACISYFRVMCSAPENEGMGVIVGAVMGMYYSLCIGIFIIAGILLITAGLVSFSLNRRTIKISRASAFLFIVPSILVFNLSLSQILIPLGIFFLYLFSRPDVKEQFQ